MSAHMIAPSSDVRRAQPASFGRAGGIAACLAGLGGLLYAISFVIIARSAPALGGLLSALLLTLNGVLGTLVMTALYERVRAHGGAALWAWLLGSVAALGAAIHGGYDLANALHPPATLNLDLPSAIDPRGLLTFGLAGIALVVFAWLVARQPDFPKGLAYLGYLLAALLVVIYLGRLLLLDPAHPLLLAPVLLTGFLVNPAWYIWLGIVLLREPQE
jgi:hypothetical protein